MLERKIVCITGMPGAGKSFVSEAFSRRGGKIIVMSQQLRRKYVEEGYAGESFENFAARMREKYGRDIVAKLSLEGIETKDSLVIMEGVRNREEVDLFSRKGKTVVVAVHAPPRLRRERLLARMRDVEETTIEAIVKRDMENLKLGIGEVIAMADYMIVNDDGLDQFKSRIEEVVRRVLEDGSS
jgi:Dephospho-CoA kinase